MLGNIVLLCFPLLVPAAGRMSSGGRRNALFCAVFAFILFFFAASGSVFGSGPAGTEGERLALLFSASGELPYAAIKDMHCPPAFMFLMKLFCMSGADVNVFVIFAAGLSSISAALFIYSRCSSSCEGAYIFMIGAAVTAYISLSLFMALSVCAHAFSCLQERRFVRAAAFAALAACFDAAAIIAAPYFLISLIPNVIISSVVCAAVSAAFAFIPGMTDTVYSLFAVGTYHEHTAQTLCAAFTAAGAVTALLMLPMLKKRNEELTGQIPLLCGGTALMFVSAADGRLFAPAVMLAIPAAVILAPDIHIISVRFAQILFPEKSGRAGLTVTISLAALAFIPYVYMILTGCCGTDAFGISLFGEAALR